LTGAPGVGKTRVLDAMLTQLGEQLGGMRVLRMAGDPLSRLAPWHGLRQLVDELSGQIPDAHHEALVASMNPSTGAAEVFGEQTEQGVAARLDRADCFGRALQQLTTHQVVAIVIDDAHAMDVPTLEICNTLLQRCSDHPLLLVLAGWEPMLDTASNLFSNPQMIYEELTALDPVSMRQFLVQELGDLEALLPPDILDLLVSHTRGNPLFLKEIAHDMRQKYARFGADGFDPGAFALPLTLEDLYRARVEKLSGLPRDLLNRCATGGVAFGLATAAGEDHLASTLATLEGTRVLRPDAAGTWDFINGALVDVARETCSALREASLHDEAALWFESQTPVQSREVAFHCVRGTRLADSVEFWQQAATKATVVGDFRSAAEALGVCVALTYDPAEKSRLNLDRVACLAKVHEWNQVTTVLGELPSRVVSADPALGADHTFWCAEAITSGGAVGSDEETLMSLLRESLEYAEQLGDSFRRVRALCGLACLEVLDDARRAQDTLQQAQALLTESGSRWDPLVIASFRVQRAVDPGDNLRAKAHQLLHDEQTPLRADLRLRILEEWTDIEIDEAQWDAASLLLEELVLLARIIGNPIAEAEAMHRWAHVSAMLDRPDRQERLLERTLALAVRLGHQTLIDACQRDRAGTTNGPSS